MERFDYVILTEENTWEGTGKNATQEELDSDLKEIRSRLGSNDEGDDVQLVVFKAKSMETFTV